MVLEFTNITVCYVSGSVTLRCPACLVLDAHMKLYDVPCSCQEV